jgi:hypothetical protein
MADRNHLRVQYEFDIGSLFAEHLSPDIRICGSKEDGVYPNVFIGSQATGGNKKEFKNI